MEEKKRGKKARRERGRERRGGVCTYSSKLSLNHYKYAVNNLNLKYRQVHGMSAAHG